MAATPPAYSEPVNRADPAAPGAPRFPDSNRRSSGKGVVYQRIGLLPPDLEAAVPSARQKPAGHHSFATAPLSRHRGTATVSPSHGRAAETNRHGVARQRGRRKTRQCEKYQKVADTFCELIDIDGLSALPARRCRRFNVKGQTFPEDSE
ncbi:MAG: hypothetical protein PVH31_00260 [Ectothiorhodospiraceae bacterium]|jgi:hypothetical protein